MFGSRKAVAKMFLVYYKSAQRLHLCPDFPFENIQNLLDDTFATDIRVIYYRRSQRGV